MQAEHLSSSRVHFLGEPVRLVGELKTDNVIGEVCFLEGEGDSVRVRRFLEEVQNCQSGSQECLDEHTSAEYRVILFDSDIVFE